MKSATLFILSVVLSGYCIQAQAQSFNRPVPDVLYPYEFVQYQEAVEGYYLSIPFHSRSRFTDIPTPLPVLFDENGYVAWYMQSEAQNIFNFQYFPDHERFGYLNIIDDDQYYYTLMNKGFEVTDSFQAFETDPGVHELQILENGHYVISALNHTEMDLSNHTFNGEQGSAETSVREFVIQEFDEDLNLVFQWNSADHIHPTESYYEFWGYNPDDFNYAHGNAIEEDDDGHFLVSFRRLNAVYKIHRNTGEVIWSLGGKSGDFTFVNDEGFSGQHDIRRLPNGNLTLYDNANQADEPRDSRAVEYALDKEDSTATLVWEFTYDPPFFARAMGNYQQTVDGYHLLNYGYVHRPHPSITNLDPGGDLVADFFFEDSVISYRSSFHPMPGLFERKEINCRQDNGAVILSAPEGHDSYRWSTGETTSSITVDEAGTYQAWYNHGRGMAGTYPVTINDPEHDCQVNPLSRQASDRQSERGGITGIYDHLGRAVSDPLPGKVYIVRYENGETQQLIFWE